MKIFCSIIFFIGAICLASCNSKPNQEQTTAMATPTAPVDSNSIKEAETVSYNEIQRIDSALVSNNVSDTSKAFIVTNSCAITFYPDEMHTQQQMQADSEGFNSLADDFSYYTAMASDTLESHHIPMTSYSHQKRFILFKGKPDVVYTLDGDKISNSWGTVLFNGKDTPVLWNGTDIGPTVRVIFKN